MTGYFWLTKDVNCVWCIYPFKRERFISYCFRRNRSWSKAYGVTVQGNDSAWSMLSTARHEPYIEIQGGPLGNQSIKAELQPGELKWHAEYWFPTDHANGHLHPESSIRLLCDLLNEIPLFDWAREESVAVWIQLSGAFKAKTALPDPPAVEKCLWAPSGMEDLDAAF